MPERLIAEQARLLTSQQSQAELKMLRTIDNLSHKHKMDIQSTYLAHAVPKWRNSASMTAEVIGQQLPRLSKLKEKGHLQLDNIDVFCEDGFYSREDARAILQEGIKMGLTANFHGDELNDLACGELAQQVGARAVSHLEMLNSVGVQAMA